MNGMTVWIGVQFKRTRKASTFKFVIHPISVMNFTVVRTDPFRSGLCFVSMYINEPVIESKTRNIVQHADIEYLKCFEVAVPHTFPTYSYTNYIILHITIPMSRRFSSQFSLH